VVHAAFSRDGRRVVTASDGGAARVWNAMTGAPLSPPLLHQGVVSSAEFSPDGTRVITASSDNTARVWDAVTGKLLSPPLQHRAAVLGAAFSLDGMRVVTVSEDRTARVWSFPLAPGTLADWRALTERVSPYVLANGVLSLRPATGASGATSSANARAP
jgi:WD40 repeat protein